MYQVGDTVVLRGVAYEITRVEQQGPHPSAYDRVHLKTASGESPIEKTCMELALYSDTTKIGG
jgi:hypothetical protein